MKWKVDKELCEIDAQLYTPWQHGNEHPDVLVLFAAQNVLESLDALWEATEESDDEG